MTISSTETIRLQREIYKIASNQHAINQLIVKDDTKSKQVLSIKVNNSSKTAIPTLLSAYDKDGMSTTTSSDQKMLYKAARIIIRNHNKREDQQPNFVAHERLSNAANNLAAEKAIRLHPELKQYYQALPSIAKEAERIPGQHNKERFSDLTKSQVIAKIVSKENNERDNQYKPSDKGNIER